MKNLWNKIHYFPRRQKGDKPFAQNSTKIVNIFLTLPLGAIFFNSIKTLHLKC